MAKRTYHVTELDPRCREYLVQVRQTGGFDMAGVYLSAGPPHSTWAFPATGLVVLLTCTCCMFNPLANPLHEAMLLTAGLLLGGWLVLAGFRITIAYLRGYDLGHFTYADPRQLWVVDHATVERWPIKTLESVSVYGQELSLEYPDGVERVAIPFEVGILEIAAYLDYWVQARGSGELNQELIDAHASVARATAYDQAPADQPDFSTDIPVPSKEDAGRRPWDWPILLALVCGSSCLFFIVWAAVRERHDHVVFDHVKNKTANELRRYLLDPNNKRYREQVTKLLHDKYEQKAKHVKEQIDKAQKDPDFNGSADAMAKFVTAVGEAPASVVTLRVKDMTEAKYYEMNPMVDRTRANRFGEEITNSIYDVIGQEFISVANPQDEDTTAFIEVRYKYIENKKDEHRLEWTIELRTKPDDPPIWQTTFGSNHRNAFEANAPNNFEDYLWRIKRGLTGTQLNQPFQPPPFQPPPFPPPQP